MARSTPVVRGELLTWVVDTHECQIRVGSPAWFTWLGDITTRRIARGLSPQHP